VESRSGQVRSGQNPFASSLDEFVQHQPDIVQGEAADVEAKELGCVARAQLQSDLGLGRALESGVFDLPSNLICTVLVSVTVQHGKNRRTKPT
jgi:hypothetical protein